MRRQIPMLLALVMAGVQLLWPDEAGIRLEITETVRTREFASGITLPIKCDTEGNMLLRVHREEIGRGSPILRLAPDGTLKGLFTMDAVPDLAGSRIVDFAPTATGDLYLLAQKEDDFDTFYAVRFDSDGKFLSNHKLDFRVRASQLAVFSSGDLLIAGTVPQDKSTFLGLFNGRGQLRTRLETSQDISPQPGKRDLVYKEAIGTSSLQAGDDGQVYLMRRSPTGPVYVVSQSGVVTDRISLIAPFGAQLSQIRVFHQQLLAEFVRHKHGSPEVESVILQLIDLQTKEPTRTYWHSDYHIGLVLGCCASGALSFVSQDQEHNLVLVKTKLQ